MPSGTTHTVFRGGTGEPLVLIHAFSGTRRLWDPLLAELERSFDVLAVSLAGHVDGPAFGAAPICVPSLVDAVERDLDAAGFETAHLVGNSLGGWIAFELAIRGRARSVVALSPAGGWEAGTPDERRLRPLFTRLHRMSKASLPWIDTIMRRPRLRRQALREIVAHGERVPPTAAAQMIRDSLGCSVYFELMDAILRDGPIQTLDGVDVPRVDRLGHARSDPSGRALLAAVPRNAARLGVGGAAGRRPRSDVRRARADRADDRPVRRTRARTRDGHHLTRGRA